MTTMRSIRITLSAALACLALACDDGGPTDPVDAVGLTIEGGPVVLAPGGSVRLRARNGAGDDVTEHVTWRSGDDRTVAVEAAELRALGHGLTWAIAELDDARDSVRVSVPFGETGHAVAFSLFAESDPLVLAGVARTIHPLGPGPVRTVVSASAGALEPRILVEPTFGDADTLVHVVFPGVASEGTHLLEGWTVEADPEGRFRFSGVSGAVVWIRDRAAPTRAEVWVPVEGVDVEIDESVEPPLFSDAAGVLRGRLSYEAAGLVVEMDERGGRVVGQVDARTRRVYAEFDLVQQSYPVGQGRLTVEGGAHPDGPLFVGRPQAGAWEGGLVLDVTAASAERVHHTQLWIGDPAEGVFELAPVDADSVATGGAFGPGVTWAWSASAPSGTLFRGFLEDLALSTGGTLTITRYLPAGLESFGALSGTLEAVQRTADGGSQTVRLEFEGTVTPGSHPVFPLPIPGDRGGDDGSVAHLGTGEGTLYGRVVLDGLVPVAGVPVELAGEGAAATAVSGTAGYFTFTGVGAGAYAASFETPEGYTLARGQGEVMEPLNLLGGESAMVIRLGDAEGNGALRVLPYGASGPDGPPEIEVRVWDAERTEVVTTFLTSDPGPVPGPAVAKLPPGEYRLQLVPETGFRLADPDADFQLVPVARGLLTTVPVALER